MTICRIIPYMLIMAFCGSGCAGFVGGDLQNTRCDFKMPICSDAGADYQVVYKSDAEDDASDKNIAGYITTFTLQIVPTYWTTTVHSEATILHNGTPIFTKKYKSRIHKFYGVLWVFLLPSKSINALQADEGGGIRVEWGIRERTLCKIVAEHGGKADQYCLVNEAAPKQLPQSPKPTP